MNPLEKGLKNPRNGTKLLQSGLKKKKKTQERGKKKKKKPEKGQMLPQGRVLKPLENGSKCPFSTGKTPSLLGLKAREAKVPENGFKKPPEKGHRPWKNGSKSPSKGSVPPSTHLSRLPLPLLPAAPGPLPAHWNDSRANNVLQTDGQTAFPPLLPGRRNGVKMSKFGWFFFSASRPPAATAAYWRASRKNW